jgi:hypothetical protein
MKSWISRMNLTFFTDRANGAKYRHNAAFVQYAITFASVIDDNQPILWRVAMCPARTLARRSSDGRMISPIPTPCKRKVDV